MYQSWCINSFYCLFYCRIHISIQQNSNVYCHLRIDEKDLLDCEVGIFYNDAEDTSVVIGWVSPEELVTLLECAIQGKEIPKELLDVQM